MTRGAARWMLALAIAEVCSCASPAPSDAPQDAAPSDLPPVTLPERITSDTVLDAGRIYVLRAATAVFVEPGATLVLRPGVEIRGERRSLLVVTRGAKIRAEGTAARPIVFTSAEPAGMKTAGSWGGLLILGGAPINVNAPTSGEAKFEAFNGPLPPESRYGGEDPHDSSGVLSYVRIEFAGNLLTNFQTLNNLSMAGVGDGTTIDFVQVHGGANDGIALFGGTVNLKHVVASQNWDDGFDIDNGWRGKAQFVVIQNVLHPDVLPESSNGYESDNHPLAASYTAEPRTLPTLSNVTVIGDHDYAGAPHWAALFRRGTGGHFVNHIWLGFHRGPEIRDVETLQQARDGNLTVSYSILFGNDTTANNLPATDTLVAIDEAEVFNAASHDLLGVDPGLSARASSKTAPDFTPAAGMPALTAANAAPAGTLTDPFFEPAPFVGAIGTVDWTTGWTSYPQR